MIASAAKSMKHAACTGIGGESFKLLKIKTFRVEIDESDTQRKYS
jgi:hypothetical protein